MLHWGAPQTTTQAMTMASHTEQTFAVLSYEAESALESPSELQPAKRTDASLSVREHMIVLMMGHGLSNKEIARKLCIAPETVKSHAKRIFLKLTVRTRAQAVYRATALGLI
jgi:ATP/maltotriose-dependent transcriptional regulator MalT